MKLVIVESPAKVPPPHERSEYGVGEDPAYIPNQILYHHQSKKMAGSRPFNLLLRSRDMGGTKTI